MPPSASWAPMSLVRSLLKPTITKPTRATRTTITMMAMSICCLSLQWVLRWTLPRELHLPAQYGGWRASRRVTTTRHHLRRHRRRRRSRRRRRRSTTSVWVALYDEIAESTVLLKSPTIEFTKSPVCDAGVRPGEVVRHRRLLADLDAVLLPPTRRRSRARPPTGCRRCRAPCGRRSRSAACSTASPASGGSRRPATTGRGRRGCGWCPEPVAISERPPTRSRRGSGRARSSRTGSRSRRPASAPKADQHQQAAEAAEPAGDHVSRRSWPRSRRCCRSASISSLSRSPADDVLLAGRERRARPAEDVGDVGGDRVEPGPARRRRPCR